ncbi:hypothetical protein Hanom_Chr09g00803451 [Helianthus anomalus]
MFEILMSLGNIFARITYQLSRSPLFPPSFQNLFHFMPQFRKLKLPKSLPTLTK